MLVFSVRQFQLFYLMFYLKYIRWDTVLLNKQYGENPLSYTFSLPIQVVDKDPTKKAGEFEDVSAVEKYEMTTEDYAKRTG